MHKCAVCGIEGATYKMTSPEGAEVFVCEECHTACEGDFQDKE